MFGSYSSPMVALMLYGWVPIGLLLVRYLRPVRGMVAIFVLGWLLLPVAAFKVTGIPAYTKMSAISLTSLVAVLALDSARLSTFRLRPIDAPMIAWCCTPFVSSMTNDLGAYDGFSGIVDQIINWGVPYFIGRLYFTNRESIRELAIGVAIGGMLYTPLCLYEIVMSPQLHTIVYGFYPHHQFMQSKRFDGWRPTVFMAHGLAVGLYMSSATLVALWLWRRKVVPRLLGIPIGPVAIALAGTTVLCKSTGSIAIFALGSVVLWVSLFTRGKALLLALALYPPAYMLVRGTNMWGGYELVEIARWVDADRGASLRLRFDAENAIALHTMEQPMFGWGGWGRNMVNKSGEELAVMDGFWIIALGKFGISGLTAYCLAMLLPGIVFVLRTRRDLLYESGLAPAVGLAVIVMMFVIDSLFNAMANPMYVVCAGGLAGFARLPLASPVARGRRVAVHRAAPARRVLPRPSGGSS